MYVFSLTGTSERDNNISLSVLIDVIDHEQRIIKNPKHFGDSLKAGSNTTCNECCVLCVFFPYMVVLGKSCQRATMYV